MADIKALEHPTLKVPYEILNKKFRSAQKTIDREISHVHTASSDIESCLEEKKKIKDVSRVIDNMVEKLCLLKRKADESINEELEAARVIKRRVDHLKEAELLHPHTKPLWHKKRLDRMLVEYFLRAGFYNTAIKLAQQSEIEDLTNIELFLTSKKIEESLQRKEVVPCLTWCYENKNKLRKMKSTLEFKLRKQEFIEHIRNSRCLEAVKHARKHFSVLEDDQKLAEVQRVMGLLAFPGCSSKSPYKDLLDENSWADLVKQFRYENFKLHQLNTDSVFTITLQAGLSALKTPMCYKQHAMRKSSDCPVCNCQLNELGKGLPYSHCANSKLICAISGQALNEHNPPMALPNGHVYGYNSLNEMADGNDGRIVCPRTKEIFHIDETEKVFVM
ncbi:E3 ubiquitin-protein transferase MAEA-like [Mytilus californianus]|uniref:E3 ubiquitin-protein transferase MAEA-like n=1 Tax=Mytilus californianus TaxID=6549 RepID=UPI002246DB40|nr:E3 ubiquitin-protein transferase MAEA-like [Mytilus californianus]